MKQRIEKISISLFVIAILQASLTSLMIYLNKYHPFLIVSWIVSIGFLLSSCLQGNKTSVSFKSLQINKLKLALILIAVSLPSIVRIALINSDNKHYHDDEFLMAYYATTAKLNTNVFAGFPENNDWEIKLPLTFFLIPKTFLYIFGNTIFIIKAATIPYVLITSIFLFLIAKLLFDSKTAVISLIMYAFFPISMYLETLGIHVVSSSAVFLPFLYTTILNFKKHSYKLSIVQGLLCGLNYLFYPASFVALPVMTTFFIVSYIRHKKISSIINYSLTLASLLVILGPFLTYAFTHENYFTQRIDQISLFAGSWSPYKTVLTQGEDTFYSVLLKHTLISIRSLYTHGIGGAVGFNFSHLAFFEPFTLYLLLTGTVLGLISQKRREVMVLISFILLSLSEVIFSIPPPAYHRLSLAFPFLAILLSLPFAKVLSFKNIPVVVKYIVVLVLLKTYIFTSYNYFKMSIAEEKYFEPLKLASFINSKYPQRNIFITAYPGYAFEKIYYFSKNKSALSIKTDYPDNILDYICPEEDYLFVTIFPNELSQKIKEYNPGSKIVYQSPEYGVIIN